MNLPLSNQADVLSNLNPLPKVNSQELVINRLEKHLDRHYEIKDPSVVQDAPDHFVMYASIGNSLTQQWLVGRFEAASPDGPWQEMEPVEFVNLSGPQLCAPAVTVEQTGDQTVYHMYIQTACFEEGGVIAEAFSTDSQTFVGTPQPLISKDSIVNSPTPVVGVYDVGVSEVTHNQEELLCMLYSGYRRVGCGDLYMSYRKKHQVDWTGGECILPQEQVPFHNHPDDEHFEWGLEGAKLIQLADDCFMLIGVCFMPLPDTYAGKRQRVFISAAKSLNGPFTPIGTPFEPVSLYGKQGENGHPDTLIIGDTLWVIYQERYGADDAWYLRVASFNIPDLVTQFQQYLSKGN